MSAEQAFWREERDATPSPDNAAHGRLLAPLAILVVGLGSLVLAPGLWLFGLLS